jgi:hypothetical protein
VLSIRARAYARTCASVTPIERTVTSAVSTAPAVATWGVSPLSPPPESFRSLGSMANKSSSV